MGDNTVEFLFLVYTAVGLILQSRKLEDYVLRYTASQFLGTIFLVKHWKQTKYNMPVKDNKEEEWVFLTLQQIQPISNCIHIYCDVYSLYNAILKRPRKMSND